MSNVNSDVTSDIAKTTEKVEKQTNQLITYVQNNIPNMLDFGIKVILTIVLFFIGRLLIRLIRKVINKSLVHSRAETGVIQFIDSLVKYGLYILLIFLLITQFGVSSAAVAAVLGSAGVAIGLALQGSLSNFAGGVLILLLKPFRVGDYIVEHENNMEGTVKEIQIFYTKLTTVDNQTIVIPNGKITNNSLTNSSAMGERQLDLKIGICYDADLKLAKSLIENLLEKEQRIIKTKDRNVFVDSLGPYAIVLGVRAWVKKDDYLPTRWDLLEQIKLGLDENKIMLATCPAGVQ